MVGYMFDKLFKVRKAPLPPESPNGRPITICKTHLLCINYFPKFPSCFQKIKKPISYLSRLLQSVRMDKRFC